MNICGRIRSRRSSQHAAPEVASNSKCPGAEGRGLSPSGRGQEQRETQKPTRARQGHRGPQGTCPGKPLLLDLDPDEFSVLFFEATGRDVHQLVIMC